MARRLVRRLNLLLGGLYRRSELFVYLVERLARLYHARVLFLVSLFGGGYENLLARLVRKKFAYLGELRDKRKVGEILAVALELLHEVPLCGGRVVRALVGSQNSVDVAQLVSVHVVEVFERNGFVLLSVFDEPLVELLDLRLLLGDLYAQLVYAVENLLDARVVRVVEILLREEIGDGRRHVGVWVLKGDPDYQRHSLGGYGAVFGEQLLFRLARPEGEHVVERRHEADDLVLLHSRLNRLYYFVALENFDLRVEVLDGQNRVVAAPVGRAGALDGDVGVAQNLHAGNRHVDGGDAQSVEYDARENYEGRDENVRPPLAKNHHVVAESAVGPFGGSPLALSSAVSVAIAVASASVAAAVAVSSVAAPVSRAIAVRAVRARGVGYYPLFDDPLYGLLSRIVFRLGVFHNRKFYVCGLVCAARARRGHRAAAPPRGTLEHRLGNLYRIAVVDLEILGVFVGQNRLQVHIKNLDSTVGHFALYVD